MHVVECFRSFFVLLRVSDLPYTMMSFPKDLWTILNKLVGSFYERQQLGVSCRGLPMRLYGCANAYVCLLLRVFSSFFVLFV